MFTLEFVKKMLNDPERFDPIHYVGKSSVPIKTEIRKCFSDHQKYLPLLVLNQKLL